MTDFLNWLNGEIIWGPPLIALIIITGVYVTVRSRFFQVCHLGYIFKRTLGCILRKDHVQDENDKGLLSPYEAIATAVGGSVGFGNIAGVATAVTTGGPGAVLWMWLTAFMGMLIKQVEVTLAVYYRRTDEEGNPYERNGCPWHLYSALASLPPFSSAHLILPPPRCWHSPSG